MRSGRMTLAVVAEESLAVLVVDAHEDGAVSGECVEVEDPAVADDCGEFGCAAGADVDCCRAGWRRADGDAEGVGLVSFDEEAIDGGGHGANRLRA